VESRGAERAEITLMNTLLTPSRPDVETRSFASYMLIVRESALYAADDDLVVALSISTRRWDEARRKSLLEGPMTASSICRTIRLSWSLTLRSALTDSADSSRIASYSAQRIGYRIPDETMLAAIRMVAGANKGVAPTAIAYDEYVQGFERRRERQYGVEMGLPSSSTIINRFSTWESACGFAGFGDPKRATRGEQIPAYESLVECVSEVGFVPAREWLARWCQIRGIRSTYCGLEWHEIVGLARAEYEKSGRTWPRRARRGDLVPLREMRATPSAVKSLGALDRDDALESLRRYVATLDSGQRPRTKHYQQLTTAEPGLELCALNSVLKYGRFQDLIAEAIKTS
jgi:hypothetical protein